MPLRHERLVGVQLARERGVAATHLAGVRARNADLKAMEKVLEGTVRQCNEGIRHVCPFMTVLSRPAGRLDSTTTACQGSARRCPVPSQDRLLVITPRSGAPSSKSDLPTDLQEPIGGKVKAVRGANAVPIHEPKQCPLPSGQAGMVLALHDLVAGGEIDRALEVQRASLLLRTGECDRDIRCDPAWKKGSSAILVQVTVSGGA